MPGVPERRRPLGAEKDAAATEHARDVDGVGLFLWLDGRERLDDRKRRHGRERLHDHERLHDRERATG